MAKLYLDEKLPEFRRWYAFCVITGREDTVKAELERELAELPDVDCAILVPKRELVERKGGTGRTVLKVMFPGYVIIGTERINEFASAAKRNSNVLYALTGDSEYLEIYPDEISCIIYMQDDDGVIVMSEVEYDKDNRIRVLAGPLKGQEGRITKVDRRKGRVKVKFALANIRREIWLGVRVVDMAISTE
ncbi:MAG: antiterminator LoaP [Oscillospiraceae bacterium]|jgi:transcriptional antiterminator NusG|nr:antiterminator LoaP [Oscillospiraceae bacterium]